MGRNHNCHGWQAYPDKMTTASGSLPGMNNHPLMTIQEASEAMRIPESSIRRWIRLGTLRSVRPGRRRFVLRSDIEALLTPQQATQQEATKPKRQDRRTDPAAWPELDDLEGLPD